MAAAAATTAFPLIAARTGRLNEAPTLRIKSLHIIAKFRQKSPVLEFKMQFSVVTVRRPAKLRDMWLRTNIGRRRGAVAVFPTAAPHEGVLSSAGPLLGTLLSGLSAPKESSFGVSAEPARTNGFKVRSCEAKLVAGGVARSQFEFEVRDSTPRRRKWRVSLFHQVYRRVNSNTFLVTCCYSDLLCLKCSLCW